MTGNAQVAECWLHLSTLTGDRVFLEAAGRINAFGRRLLAMEGDEDIRGAVRGSFPISGEYGRFQYLTWAAKFSTDANILEKEVMAPQG